MKDDSYYGSDLSDEEEDDLDSDSYLDSGDEDEDQAPRRQTRRSSFLEFDQETKPRGEVLKRLAFCSLMLNITFVMWGALQVSARLYAQARDTTRKAHFRIFSGTNVDSALPPTNRGILYLFLRFGIHK